MARAAGPPLIAAGYSCIALDFPGNGKSTGKVGKEEEGAFVEKLLLALGVPEDSGCVVAVGDGMGSKLEVRGGIL